MDLDAGWTVSGRENRSRSIINNKKRDLQWKMSANLDRGKCKAQPQYENCNSEVEVEQNLQTQVKCFYILRETFIECNYSNSMKLFSYSPWSTLTSLELNWEI